VKYVSALAIVASLIGNANAEEAIAVIGYQKTTCGTWTKERRASSASAIVYEGWLAGFLSGWAVSEAAFNPLANLDPEAVYDWVDNYCSTHPLDVLSVAAVTLTKELLTRAKRSN